MQHIMLQTGLDKHKKIDAGRVMFQKLGCSGYTKE